MISVSQTLETVVKLLQPGDLRQAAPGDANEVGDMPRQAGQAATAAALPVVAASAPSTLGDAGSTPAAEAPMEDVAQTPTAFQELAETLARARERQEQGDWPEAERLYRQCVQVEPNAVEAQNGLGIVLARQGRVGEAEICFRQVTRLVPDSAQARSNLGNVLRQQGRLAEAEASQRQALYLEPGSALAHNNLGLVLAAQGRQAEAEACYREALRRQPDFASAHDSLGNTLRDQGRLPESEASHREALRLMPRSAFAHNHLGLTLAALGRLAEAEACYRQAIQLKAPYAEANLNLGQVLKDQGKLEEAIVCVRQALACNANYAEAHYALGNALKDQRKYAEAEACYRETLRLKPGQPEVHNNLGIVLMDLGKFEESVASYQQTLRFKPDFAATHNNLGIVLMRLERVDEAVLHLRQALRSQPDFTAAHNNLGVALQKQGKLEEAMDCFRQALHWSPDFVEACNNLGNIHKDRGEKAEAEACFKQTVRLKPNDADARNHFAIFLMDLGKMGESLAEFHEALRIRPDFPEAHNNFGLALQKHGQCEQAEASLRRAISLRPNFYEAINNLGNVLKDLGKLDEAVACYQQSVALKPDFAGGHSNLGIMYFQEGQLPAALACYERALAVDPEYADARWNRSLLWLMGGNFAQGWPEYEWRWQRPECPKRAFAMPAWQGDDLAGRTILLHAEQGLGDTLQFIRYAPLVKERGGTVVVECQSVLARLLRHCPDIDAVLAQGDPLPNHDVHAALLSLPHLLGTHSLESIPRDVPYLRPDPDLVEHWRARLASVPGLRVGITWQGNPSHRGDRWRSVPLSMFAELAKVPGVSLVSLQKGAGSDQLEQTPGLALDLAAEFLDMADTAAALKSLDLVVTVDSAVGHLAGALGVPVWVALPFAPDWRWLLRRPDTPWYPSMRLFRQPGWKRWDEVFQRIAEALASGEWRAKSAALNERPIGEGESTGDLPAAFSDAVELHKAGQREQAERMYRRIVQDDPSHAGAWHFLGLIAHEGGRNEEALGCLSRAVALAPEDADAHNNFGIVLQRLGKLPEAEAHLRRALILKPEFAESHNNLAGVLKDLGKPRDALAEYEQALRLDPEDADCHWNLALLHLLMGNFERGWAEFEWRRRRETRPDYLQFTQPEWAGEDLAGRTILLHAAHGLGDALQFARFAALVKERAGKVLLACHPPLKSLFGGLAGVDQVLAWDEPLPPFDVQAPLLSLPRLLGATSLERIPAQVPYLDADPERVERWRARLLAYKGLRIGIAWQGNPQFQEDRWRSVPVTRFEALARIPGVKLFSLQKGFGAEQWRDVGKRWAAVDFGAELDADGGAFLDSAAIMKSLDLVVTTDTALAHLAGALGVPAWVALPFVPDWRWLLERPDSPWYPSMRLFRQNGPGQWMPVFDRIAEEIKKLPAYATHASAYVPPAVEGDRRHPSAFELALQHHQAGDLRQAERFYRQVHAGDQRYAETLHYLGLIAYQDGRIDQAVESMRQALALRPDYAEAHNNLAVALQKRRELAAAAESLRQALRLNPEFAEAHNNLGNVLKDQGQLDLALASYQAALRLKPRDAELHYNLGIVLHEQKKLVEAASAYGEALRLRPNYLDAHIRLGNLLGEQGQHREAAVHYREVLRLKPDYAEIRTLLDRCLKAAGTAVAGEAGAGKTDDAESWNDRGALLEKQGNLAEAEASYRQAVRLKPDFGLAHGNLALVLSKQEQWAQAEASYRAALRYRPDFAEAHNGLGDVLLHRGRPRDAEDCFRRAQRLRPDSAEVHGNLTHALLATDDLPPRVLTNAATAAFDQAVRRHQAGNLRKAERLYRQVLKDDPRHAEALHYLGLVCLQDGRTDEAVRCLRQALAARPNDAQTHNNLGVALQKQQHLAEAADSLRQALLLKPDFAEAHNNLGNVLKDQGHFGEAFASYQQALRLKPGDAEVCFNLGIVLHDQKKLEEATGFYREALRLRPNYVDAHVRLGNVLAEKGRLEEATVQYRQALRLKPDFAECYINLGNALKDMGFCDEAESSYREALRLKPDFVEAHTSLGNLFLQTGQLQEAEACCRRGLEIQADHADANWNLALLRLLQGDFQCGWEGYEWRWRRPDQPHALPGPQPRWLGEAMGDSLDGRTLLLCAEQGLGDTIQFVRFASLLARLADRPARVLLACHPPLKRLLGRCAGIDAVFAFGDPLPAFDTHALLMSLPHLLGITSPERIPADVPYLEADPELILSWRERLKSLSGLRIGIAWQGNPAYKGDRWRSASPPCFAELARVPGVSLVSLQKRAGSEQLGALAGLAYDAGPHLTDLAETAAAMQCLDLVVTVDSVLAHLAGALGVPVWIALPFAPDWRWLLERTDSPWYPSARLFRQTKLGDWSDVFERIAEEARQLVVARGITPSRQDFAYDPALELEGDLEQAERHCRRRT